MKVNDWEDRGPTWLIEAFDEDSKDIVDHLVEIDPVVIMEVGFGNSRLLPRIIERWSKGALYYGFDKTKAFVKRAKEKFPIDRVYLDVLDIEDEEKFLRVVRMLAPDVLILRYVVEHLPKWKDVLKSINDRTMIPNLFISLYVSATDKESWTGSIEGDGHEYTVNYISDNDLDKSLSLYCLERFYMYKGVAHTFRIYKRRS